jgi:hypothetical protein
MATIKKVKAKNLSAGPSKKTPIAPKVDPKGQYTKVQERTLGNMKKGGSIKKKGGMAAYEKSSYDKKMDAKGTHGGEGSAKDMAADKKAAKKLGYLKKGGKVKNWIQGAVNPEHKGYCTPMTKATCTPKRKALAMTFKKMAKKK